MTVPTFERKSRRDVALSFTLKVLSKSKLLSPFTLLVLRSGSSFAHRLIYGNPANDTDSHMIFAKSITGVS